FSTIEVESTYEGNKKRKFIFNNRFDGKSKVEQLPETSLNGSALRFKGFHNERVKSYEYLKPESIKESIRLHFLPLLYSMKIEGKTLKIKISLSTDESNTEMGFETSSHEF